ncbi:MAG: LysR family transcriptional regulator [Pseudoruegeria sp.]
MLSDPRRLRELEIFALAANEGNFSKAARASGLTPSSVSKTIARLEARLGAQLVIRTTRAVTLTVEGKGLLERTTEILSALKAAEREVSVGREPSGSVHLSTSASYAHHRLYPILPKLLELYPGLNLTVSQTDRVVDLIGSQADLAIRAGEMPSSALIARTLGTCRKLLVATPDYLKRDGPVTSIEALSQCNLIGFSYRRRGKHWPDSVNDQIINVKSELRLQSDEGEALRQMALNGLGIAFMAEFTVLHDLKAGRLQEVLPNLCNDEAEPFHVVRVGVSGTMPARIRVVLDFLAKHGRVDHETV